MEFIGVELMHKQMEHLTLFLEWSKDKNKTVDEFKSNLKASLEHAF